jgi:hypothetical protein
VQQAYEQMMRGQIAPALRELGFTGTLRIFRYRGGSRKGEIRWIKDARQTRNQILRFAMNLGWCCAGGRLYELMPEPATDTWWTVRGGQPTGPVADSVVAAVRCYVLPAILAGLDHPDDMDDGIRPGQPPAPVGHVPGYAADEPPPAGLLLDLLEHDPSPAVRAQIASRQLPRLGQDPQVLAALRASAAGDQDFVVRWAARYALRLDLDRDPGRAALARWPRSGGIDVP